MFRFGRFFVFQTALFFISDQSEAATNSTRSTALYSTVSVVVPIATSSVALISITPSSTFSATTTSARPVTNATTAQPTVTNATTAQPTVTNPTTAQPPAGGEQEAVVLYVSDLTSAKFEERRDHFTATVEKVVESYCSNSSQKCDESSRKRRQTSAYQVYIVPGFPKQDPHGSGDLLVGFFVSIGENKFLSKNVLFAIVQEPEYRNNLSTALGYQITGVARLHYDFITPTEFSGTSGKTMLLYLYFAGFAGAVLLAGLCIGVTCWYGRKKEKDDEVRPLTTSNLHLVDK